LAPLYTTARSKRRGTIVWFEAAAMLAFTAGLTIASPFYVLQFVLPVWFLGQAAALAENYLEHHHAIPGHRLTDSVSCYNTLYNLIWFNNGYHQEHHYRPTVHWTEVPPLRGEMLPETDRRVVKGAHWFNFGSVRKAADKPVLQAIPDEAQRR
jgi:fatty acid desaturase